MLGLQTCAHLHIMVAAAADLSGAHMCTSLHTTMAAQHGAGLPAFTQNCVDWHPTSANFEPRGTK